MNEPNNSAGEEHCVEVKESGGSYKWNAENCNDEKQFICEL